MSSKPTILLTGESLDASQVEAIAQGRAEVVLDERAIARVVSNRLAVDGALEAGVSIYGAGGQVGGVSTDESSRSQAENDLVRGTAAGTGAPLPAAVVRAAIVIHLNTLLRGHSGVRVVLAERIAAMLNAGLAPYVPSKGSAGASGDLAPSAHAFLPLVGEGFFLEGSDSRRPARQVLRAHELEPLGLAPKEAISILNGTHFMAAIGALTIGRAAQLLDSADAIAAMTIDGLSGASAAFDARVHELRPYDGQARSAAIVRCLVRGSKRIDSLPNHIHDAYSLRCVPQVHGSARLGHGFFEQTMTVELNAVTDNPIVFDSPLQVVSAGNFHGQPLSLAFDTLRIALADLAALSERRIFRLVSPSLNGNLPSFLVGADGRGIGYMVSQFTCTALLAELRVLAQPVSIDSVPTLDNLEDHVSFGMTAGTLTLQCCDLVETVLAIEAMLAAQALESGDTAGEGVRHLQQFLRRYVAPISADRPPADDLEAVRSAIATPDWRRMIEQLTAVA